MVPRFLRVISTLIIKCVKDSIIFGKSHFYKFNVIGDVCCFLHLASLLAENDTVNAFDGCAFVVNFNFFLKKQTIVQPFHH